MYSNGGPIEFFETPWLNPGTFTYSKVLYDHLIVADENLQPKEGQLAKDYSLSEDGKELKIIVMDDGRISAIGTHDELMNTSEIYKDVYNSQQEGVGFGE